MAAIDESGTQGDSSNIVVATVLASVKAWGELAPKWEAILKDYGLSYSHAFDLNCGKGECAKLTEEQRVDCAKSLIGVAGDGCARGAAHAQGPLRVGPFVFGIEPAGVEQEHDQRLAEVGVAAVVERLEVDEIVDRR